MFYVSISIYITIINKNLARLLDIRGPKSRVQSSHYQIIVSIRQQNATLFLQDRNPLVCQEPPCVCARAHLRWSNHACYFLRYKICPCGTNFVVLIWVHVHVQYAYEPDHFNFCDDGETPFSPNIHLKLLNAKTCAIKLY